MMLVGAYSDRGRVKTVDQDACCFLEVHTPVQDVALAVVCDGVGGLATGELASATVVHRSDIWLQNELPHLLKVGGAEEMLQHIERSWHAMLSHANEDLRTYGVRNGMLTGTTFTGMLVIGECYLIGHVGDCRAYEVRPGVATQLTEDQTFANYQLSHGLMSEEQLAHHPKRKMLMQAIGTQDNLEPAFVCGTYDASAVYVLCCDGICKRMDANDLPELFGDVTSLGKDVLHERCAQLAWRVLERGERDNVTVVAFARAKEATS